MFVPKATENTIIRTTEEIPSDFRDLRIPSGTEGVVIEIYENPEGYCVDLFLRDGPDENVILKPQQFEVIERHDAPVRKPSVNKTQR